MGHVEEGETAYDAMVREFEEEAGASIGWKQVGVIGNDNFELSFFVSNEPCHIDSITDEEIDWYYGVPEGVIDNLNWMIPMARYALEHDMYAEIDHMDDTC